MAASLSSTSSAGPSPNTIPTILSNVDPMFNNTIRLLSELIQYHPRLKVSKVRQLDDGSFSLVGDTSEDFSILQSQSKMRVCFGKNVKVSLPKEYQPVSSKKTKSVVVKGVPVGLTDEEFRTILNLNNIDFAKAERMKSKKDGRIFPMFRLELSNYTQAEALISNNLTCRQTGRIYKVEKSRS